MNHYLKKAKECPEPITKKLYEARGQGMDEGLSQRKKELDILQMKFRILDTRFGALDTQIEAIEKDARKLKKELRDYGKLLMGTLLEE